MNMDAESNEIMIDVDDANPQNYAFGALDKSDSAYVANAALDEATLYIAIQDKATVNTVSFNIRNVIRTRLTAYEYGTFVEERVSMKSLACVLVCL